MWRLNVLMFLIVVRCAVALPQSQPTSGQLEKITARGRMLAEYLAASKNAVDAVKARDPKSPPPLPICEKVEAAWTCVFGRFDSELKAFLIDYEATSAAGSVEFQVKQNDPPMSDKTDFYDGARAVRTAAESFKATKPQRPYVFAVLPAESKQWYVYLIPAQTRPGVYPLGGDVRYLISTDGSKIIETRQLHKTIIENQPAANTVAGFHTHVLSDTPEDTDVLFVLTRKPSMQEYIATPKQTYLVEKDGTITLKKR